MEQVRGVGRVRLVGLLLIAGLLVLLMTGAALAATPQEIYDDWAADGDLDGSYTDAELRAVLTDPTLAQYADQEALDALSNVVNRGSEESEFPFTGAQMLLIAAVGIVLVGGGVFLRRGSKKTS